MRRNGCPQWAGFCKQASNAELQAIADQSVTRTAYLRVAETLNTFLTRLRSSASALDVSERQRIVRLLVKEVLVGDDKIIIRHCIPLPNRSDDGDGPSTTRINAAPAGTEGYLLRSRSHGRAPCQRRLLARVCGAGLRQPGAAGRRCSSVRHYAGMSTPRRPIRVGGRMAMPECRSQGTRRWRLRPRS
jgi:site-specific DNA recombinase